MTVSDPAKSDLNRSFLCPVTCRISSSVESNLRQFESNYSSLTSASQLGSELEIELRAGTYLAARNRPLVIPTLIPCILGSAELNRFYPGVSIAAGNFMRSYFIICKDKSLEEMEAELMRTGGRGGSDAKFTEAMNKLTAMLLALKQSQEKTGSRSPRKAVGGSLENTPRLVVQEVVTKDEMYASLVPGLDFSRIRLTRLLHSGDKPIAESDRQSVVAKKQMETLDVYCPPKNECFGLKGSGFGLDDESRNSQSDDAGLSFRFQVNEEKSIPLTQFDQMIASKQIRATGESRHKDRVKIKVFSDFTLDLTIIDGEKHELECELESGLSKERVASVLSFWYGLLSLLCDLDSRNSTTSLENESSQFAASSGGRTSSFAKGNAPARTSFTDCAPRKSCLTTYASVSRHILAKDLGRSEVLVADIPLPIIGDYSFRVAHEIQAKYNRVSNPSAATNKHV